MDIFLLRAIEIQEKALGPEHPSLAASLATRAGLLHEQVRDSCRETFPLTSLARS